MTWLVLLPGYAVFLYVAHRVELALERRWDKDRGYRVSRLASVSQRRSDLSDIAKRAIALEERKFEKASQVAAQKPMPQALVDRIRSWEDEWAQDQERSEIMALYAEYGDWDIVATKLQPLTT